MSLLDETTDQLRTKDVNCICACTHLTDLVVFVKGSCQPLLSSNYNALTSLKYLTYENLKRNLLVSILQPEFLRTEGILLALVHSLNEDFIR